MKRLICALLLFSCAASLTDAEPIIFLARHAEKSGAPGADPKDPDLSETGRQRAEFLARVLRDAGISAVFATEFRRTQQTAEPAAKAAGVKLTIVPANDTPALLARLREERGNCLVIGHSNTISEIIRGLGVADPAPIAKSEYDNLFVLIRDPAARLLRLHY